MAYSRPPWEIEAWPSVWITRTLAELEQVEPPPEFGALANQGGGEHAQQQIPGL